MSEKKQEKMSVLSDISSFEKRFPKAPKEGERRSAVEKYFGIGGVVKAFDSDKEWPKLSYPSVVVLDSKIREVDEKSKIIREKLNEWRRAHSNAANYHQFNQVKKLKEPLYWKHMAKMATDSDYRKDAEAVKLPAHLVSDKKWQPMVKMFVNDLEYRKQLAETVRTSVAYKKERKVARYADQLKDFRMETSDRQIKDLEEKLNDLEETQKSLREMQKWARE
jgi:hypothetical protein